MQWLAIPVVYLGTTVSAISAGPGVPAGTFGDRIAALQEATTPRTTTGEDPVKQALRARSYPWYDPATDGVRSAAEPWLNRPRKQLARMWKAVMNWLDRLKFGRVSVGNGAGSLGTLVLLSLLVAFFLVLVMLWLRQDGISLGGRDGARARLGTAARLAELPEGIRPGGDDPWAEALARRAAGDLAGATVCLFAHQLLSLEQLGLIRLAPGRTARHYVKAVQDADFRDAVAATLGLFEDVYYGRRRPTTEAFESVWSRAETFQERRRLLGVSG
jgi:hypothetical protein